jgi:hypothetical protein
MARPTDFWIQLHNVFDPEEVLTGQRSQQFYVERENSPYDNMRLDFRKEMRPDRPPIAFFTGHRGSGKSSLLVRLLEHFKDDYFVVYFDIDHNLDYRRANQIDILYLLGAAIFQVAVQEGLNPDSKNLLALAESVYTVTKTKQDAKNRALQIGELVKGLLGFGASMLGAKLAEKFAEAALKPFNLTSEVSEEVARKREIEPQVQEMINNINLIIADVETRANKPVFVIVDSLDKLPRFEQAQLIFLESNALREPLCRIIYTVPMLIFSSLGFGQAEEQCKAYLLPNIKLFEMTSDAARYEPGYKTMHDLVAKRLMTLGLQPDDVFEPDVLDLLIFKSGGVIRWLMRLMRDACNAGEVMGLDKLNHKAAQRAINTQVANLGSRLTRETIRELQEVRKTKRPSRSQESSELLQGLVILAYQNERLWFDAHPLIWGEL